ncbi:hypothetical protein B0H17DRAFT_1180048 [Mycena rosella]|uniref:Uncharacterized protein n=1 Tax=Mycena rosella TaxID=1033263 RepID=A0AAD7DER9_MYCRO|nr:hypothetical protein B0H17DRAFT_1180048 [Mycena rosella]
MADLEKLRTLTYPLDLNTLVSTQSLSETSTIKLTPHDSTSLVSTTETVTVIYRKNDQVTQICRDTINDAVGIRWKSNELQHRGSGLDHPIRFERGQREWFLNIGDLTLYRGPATAYMWIVGEGRKNVEVGLINAIDGDNQQLEERGKLELMVHETAISELGEWGDIAVSLMIGCG